MASIRFNASVWEEDGGYVAQCLEVDVASQGDTYLEALANLREAIELHFEPPMPTHAPAIHSLEVELNAA